MSDAEKAIKAAQKRLKTKQYGYTANQSQALAIDRRLSKLTPSQLAQERIRGARFDIARTRRDLRSVLNADAPPAWRQKKEQALARQKAEFDKFAKDYRKIKPRKPKK